MTRGRTYTVRPKPPVPTPMRVQLFVSCLVDQLRPGVGAASVEVLRRAGCEVAFDPRQTCCAQPAFNTGYRTEACGVAKSLLDVYEPETGATDEPLVLPSGSCAAMIHHLPDLFEDDPATKARAERLAHRTFELGTFLVERLGVVDLGAHVTGRVTWHDACHGLRDLGIKSAPRQLLANVRGLELVEHDNGEVCCGFGGTFSVKHAELSTAMLDDKLEGLDALEVDAVVSGDVSCLMQIGGRLHRERTGVAVLHLAEVLANQSGAPVASTTWALAE